MEKIRIRDLSFKYPLAKKNAIENINLDINRSEFVVICGRSGCGKSTLLRHMKKQLIPYGEKSGEVFIEGTRIEDLDDRKSASSTGFILQDPDSQIVTDKVWHELAFGLENLGLNTNVIKRRVAEMANYFGIHRWFEKDVSTLSGGQKQILNLASVMVMQPDILILDEPTSQLDPIATTDFLNTVYRINRELGVTVIISEHRLEEVIPMADRVIVMDCGRIQANERPENLPCGLTDKLTDEKHRMFYGLPSVMRIFGSAISDKVPLTVREGRLLLEEKFSKSDIKSDICVSNTIDVEKNIKFIKVKEENRVEILKLRNLWFRYEKNGDFILKGTNLSVEKGNLTCILGGNGSGKSTLMKVIGGVLKPQRGKIHIEQNLKISMVPQDPKALFTEITAEEELFEGMRFMDLDDNLKISKVNEMLKIMEIEHLRNVNPYDMSGGEQQRLAIGKVLLTDPDLLLLDEPTKGLDPFFKLTLANIFYNLNKEGLSILAVSHDVEFCASFADRCAMFFNGEVTSEDKAREFFAGNSFYTTAANRLFRGIAPDIVTCEEAEKWLKQRL